MENSPNRKKLKLDITGMSCVNCSNSIESFLSSSDGIISATVNFTSASASVEYDPARISEAEIISLVGEIGFAAFAANKTPSPDAGEKGSNPSAVFVAFIFAVPVFILNMFYCDLYFAPPAMLVMSLPVLFFSGMNMHRKAFLTLVKRLPMTMDALVSASSLSSFALSSYLYLFKGSMSLYFDSATSIIAIILAGKAIEEKIRSRARANITGIVEGMPENATVVRDGTEMSLPLGQIASGELIILKPHQRIPIDAVIAAGEGFVDNSVITGESAPEFVRIGTSVFAGAMNIDSILSAKTTSSGKESYIGRIAELIDSALSKKAAIQKTADRISSVFVPAIFFLASLTFAIHAFGGKFEAAAICAISVVAIACPCALGLALPAAFMFGANFGAKHGILYTDPDSLSGFGRINALIFDKTGTLTENRLTVEHFEMFAEVTPGGAGTSRIAALSASGPGASAAPNPDFNTARSALAIIGSVERYSEHPIASAICDYLRNNGIDASLPVSDFKITGGSGVEGVCEGIAVRIGSASFTRTEGAVFTAGHGEGKIEFFVSFDGKPAARFLLSEKMTEGAIESIATLKKRGIDVYLLTGDREGPAMETAEKAGISSENVRFSVRPHQKAEFIEEIRKNDPSRVIAMVGDGVNDALALATADVGIAMADATSIARTTSAVILTRGGLKNVSTAIEFGAKMKRVITQNFFWAFFYNAILIPAAMAGRLDPMQAAFAMAFSSLFVVLNSTRLSRL